MLTDEEREKIKKATGNLEITLQECILDAEDKAEALQIVIQELFDFKLRFF